MKKDLEWYKEVIYHYVERLSIQSKNVVRSREHKEGVYGEFYFYENIVDIQENIDTKYVSCQLELWFKQKNYKDHCIIRKKYKFDNTEYLKDFYAQFLDDILISLPCMKTSAEGWVNSGGIQINCYSFSDLINKGLPDKDKL